MSARCRVCGCTDDNCQACIAKTGQPCSWVEPDLCSACAPAKRELTPQQRGAQAAAIAAKILSDVADQFQDLAIPPENEVGQVVVLACELFGQLDLSGATAEELQRWVALGSVVAANAAGVVAACLTALTSGRTQGRAAPPAAERPLLYAADGVTPVRPGGAAPERVLVDLSGQPISRGRRG